MPYNEYKDFKFNKELTDMANLLEIIKEVQPDFIIECGTQYGGSACQMAELLKEINGGKVITIDIKDYLDIRLKNHPHIIQIIGSSTNPGVIEKVKSIIHGKILVDLDSDHSASHVLAELEAYSPLVTAGSYLICEDTQDDFHLELPKGGSMVALTQFLPKHPEFEIIHYWEAKNTSNPCGYLRRKNI